MRLGQQAEVMGRSLDLVFGRFRGFSGLNSEPHPFLNDISVSYLRTCKCVLIWKKNVFADVIKDLELKSSYISVGPKSNENSL